jgi:asparagine synthase (glutamine-hydrolysing)
MVGRIRLGPAHRTDSSPGALDSPRAVFQGTLHNQADLIRQAGRQRIFEPPPGVRSTLDVTEALLAALYRQDGDDFVSRLEGEFALLILDPQRRRLIAATDLAGNHPIYWHASAEGVVVATDLGAVVQGRADETALDLRAVADYFTCGMVLGRKTLAMGVHALDGGAVLTHDIRQARTTTTTYCDAVSLFMPKAGGKTEYLESVADAFGTAVHRALETDGTPGLSLSGGLDSRAILSAANGTAATLTTYTLGVPGCADQVIGRRLAKLAGTRHRFFPLDASYLHDFLPNMAELVSLTGGMYLSHGLTEMLAVRVLDDAGLTVLLRGHGGELAKAHLAWPLHTDRRVYDLTSSESVADYLAERANFITPGLPLDRIFSRDAAAAAGEGARQSFRDRLRGTTLCAADCCSYLYLREQHRRFTAPSLSLFRTRVDVRLPFVDPVFLRVLLAAPPQWRDTTEIHRRITAAGIPALGRVRDSNTGAPANAGPAATFVLDRLNSVLRRLNVPGYRHYHNFDTWMRRTLLESVEAELLAPGARVQTFVPRRTLAALLEETRTGAADRSYLLQVLLILELWQRENRVTAVA